MPYQNDMSTLADVVSPAAAASAGGYQSGLSNIQDAIKANIQQNTIPQEIQKASLANALLQAQGQTQQGISAQQQAAGLTAQQEQPSTSEAGIAGNQAKLSAAQLENLSNIGGTVNKMADFLDKIPPPARPAMMQSFLDQNGVKDPGIRQAVSSGDPQLLRTIGMGLIQHSQGYVQSMDLEREKGAQQRANTELENAGRLANTKELVSGRTDVAEINKSAKAMMLKTDNIIASLTAKQAAGQLTPDEAATLNQARQAQQLARTNPFINQMLQPDASAATNQMPVAQPGSVTSPQGNVPNAALEEARRRGLIK